eukprot:4580658-Pyramimonas_sp.AAC.1
MTEEVVPAAAILAIRRLTPYREAGNQLWPEMGPMWDYPPLAPRPPLSKYEICAVPPGTVTSHDPPGIAPTAKVYDAAQQPRTQSTSA